VALVPAIGEELLFRGALLKLFTNISRNIHIAVFFTAFLFAAIHFQFYGFLPRFFIGLILGYSFVITGNLWVPIFVHFINNSASVIVYYLHYNGFINVPMEDFGTLHSPVYIIGSLLITIWLMVIVGRRKGIWFNNLNP
jgi:membrane protease YdiL (CAAX protease family)